MADESTALHYLQYIGYYRLSAYTLHFQDEGHFDKHFKASTTFEQVLALYVFDREVRLLILDAIERIEVAVRTCMVNHMSIKHGSHWFMEKALFGSKFKHDEFLDFIDDELGIPETAKKPDRPHNEVFINHYYSKYDDPYLTRKLTGHTLLQAIARVNRLYDGKDFGYILDYRGVLEELDQALDFYADLKEFEKHDVEGSVTDIRAQYAKLPQKHSELWDVFKTVKNTRDREQYERLLADEELRVRFYEKFCGLASR